MLKMIGRIDNLTIRSVNIKHNRESHRQRCIFKHAIWGAKVYFKYAIWGFSRCVLLNKPRESDFDY